LARLRAGNQALCLAPTSPWCRGGISKTARRIAARRGAKRAAVAVGHTILVALYHMLRDGATYEDLGPLRFDERDRRATVGRSVRRLEALGYRVTLEPAA
jgi:hypothetical protein